MTALDNYKLTFESLENEKKIWRTKKTGNQQFDADRAANFRSLAQSLVSRLKRNGNRATKRDNNG